MKAPWLIAKAQRVWRRWVQLPYWYVRCAVRLSFRRLFAFKDAPNWFVWWMSEQGDEHDLAIWLEFVDAASSEQETRRVHRRRLNH